VARRAIRNCRVLPGPGQDASRLLDVVLAGPRIVGLEPAGAAVVDTAIDGSNCLLAPGLINGHFHSHEHFQKGRFDNLPLELWMNYVRPPRAVPLTARQVYLRTMIGAVEALRSGTTTGVDDMNLGASLDRSHLEAVFQAYEDIGWRMPRSTPSPGTAPRRAGLALTATSASASASAARPASRPAPRSLPSARFSSAPASPASSGFGISAERHLGLQDNFSFAEVPEETVAEMARAVAREGCDAVAIVCTNLRGATLVPELETEIGLPVYDSIATTVWKGLQISGENPGKLARWGILFRDPRLRVASP
jgi:hypothetical protein